MQPKRMAFIHCYGPLAKGGNRVIIEDRFYCVGCQMIVQKEKAGRVFRTGFYKCDMHLGLCNACSESEPNEGTALLPENGHSTYMAVEPL